MGDFPPHIGGTIADDLDAPPSEIAARISDDPLRFMQALADDLNKGLTVVDDLLATGDDAAALATLRQLEQLHGPLPAIRLRQGIADIGLGRRPRIPSLTRDLPGQSLDNPGRFFDEINRRLAQPGLDDIQRQSYNRLAAYVDWRNKLMNQGMDPGRIVLAQADDGLDLQLFIDALPEGNLIGSVDDLDVAFVYVQDSPGLNNLNWNASPQAALEQAIVGDLGAVVALPAGDIAHFNPTTVYVGTAQQTKFKLQANNVWRTARFTQGYRPSNDDDCSPDQPECADQPMVYVVYAKP